MEASRNAITAVIPRHLTPERIIKAAQIAASRNPDLFECTTASIVAAVIRASELGLDPSGTLGSAYLVPFRNKHTGNREAQFIPGYRGLIDLARRSGEISSIEAHIVKQGDKFELEFGLNPKLVHVPDLQGAENRAVLAAYAVAVLRDGARQAEVMTRAQLEGIRSRSKAGDCGPWVSDWEEMARKTVVKRLVKYLPVSVELQKAIEYDNEAIGLPLGEDSLPEEPRAPEEPKTERLARRLAPPKPTVAEETGKAKAKEHAAVAQENEKHKGWPKGKPRGKKVEQGSLLQQEAPPPAREPGDEPPEEPPPSASNEAPPAKLSEAEMRNAIWNNLMLMNKDDAEKACAWLKNRVGTDDVDEIPAENVSDLYYETKAMVGK